MTTTIPREIDDLLPYVMPEAPGAPEPLVIRKIREAAIELCRRTRMWKDRETVQISGGDGEGISTIQDAAIFEILWARFDNQADLKPKTIDWLDRNYAGWQDETTTATPRFVTQTAPNTVMVYPRTEGSLSLRLALEPSINAMTLPAFLADQYAAELAMGAASKVLMMPGDWSNPQSGADKRAEWRAWLDTISTRAVKGQQDAPLRTRGRYF